MTTEQADVLMRFLDELRKPTGDGGNKRAAGSKPPWYLDTHEAQIFSHIAKWKKGETIDPDSGAHTLVHAAWRCLAIACKETGNVPFAPADPPKEWGPQQKGGLIAEWKVDGSYEDGGW